MEKMKCKAIIFCANDTIKLDFTLKNFKKHNPDIPVLVCNNGGPSEVEDIAKNYGCTYEFSESIWVKNTHCGAGSFGFEWFKRMFAFGLVDDDYTHILFLETDVYTQRPITVVPQYDMAGLLAFSGSKENTLFNYFKLGELGYKFQYLGNTRAFPHSGCGGTFYSKNFFKKAEKNLHLIEKAYIDVPQHCYMDLLITILGMISSCSFGEYPDIANLEGSYFYSERKKDYVHKKCDWNKTLIHHIKYTDEAAFRKTKFVSKYFYNIYIKTILFCVRLSNKIRQTDTG